MQTKRVLQKTARSVFLFAAVSAGSLGATEVQDIAFEEIYAVVRIESVRKPVEHSITLGDAQDGRLRMRSLIGPTELGVSVISDNCLVGYDLASPDEPTIRHRIKVWLTKESKPIEIVVGPVQSAFLPGKMLRDGPPEGEDIKVVYEVREVLKESDTRNSTVKKSVSLLSTVITLNDQFRLHEPIPTYISKRKVKIRQNRIKVLLMILACTRFRAKCLHKSCK